MGDLAAQEAAGVLGERDWRGRGTVARGARRQRVRLRRLALIVAFEWGQARWRQGYHQLLFARRRPAGPSRLRHGRDGNGAIAFGLFGRDALLTRAAKHFPARGVRRALQVAVERGRIVSYQQVGDGVRLPQKPAM